MQSISRLFSARQTRPRIAPLNLVPQTADGAPVLAAHGYIKGNPYTVIFCSGIPGPLTAVAGDRLLLCVRAERYEDDIALLLERLR